MLTFAWLASALLARWAVATSTPIIFDSYTPQLLYKPDSTNNTGQGPSWNASFTDISWANREDKRGGKIGVGQGYHWALGAVNGPSVSITFYGTGAEFFGYWGYLDNGTVSDGAGGDGFGMTSLSLTGGPDALQDVPSNGSMSGVGRPISLGKYADLSRGTYTVTMHATGGIISFTHVIIQMDVGGSVSAVTQAVANPSIYDPYIVNSDNSLGLNPKFGRFMGPPGGSTVNGTTGSWAGQSSDANKRVGSKVAQETVHINLGVGNNFLAINGTVNTNHGLFRVEIDPAPPGRQSQQDMWASTSWQVLDTVLFATGLDPDTEYSVTLTNVQGQDGQASSYNVWFDLTSLTLWKVATTSKAKATGIIGQDPGTSDNGKKNGPPIGPIVGGVVGGVAVLVGAGLAAWYFFLRRRKSSADRLFDAEPVSYMSTPYVAAGREDPNDPPNMIDPYGVQPYGVQPTSPTMSGVMSLSDGSTAYNPSHRNSVAGLMGNNPIVHQEPQHHLATDAGPFRGANPIGEMPPTYNPTWSDGDRPDAPNVPSGMDEKRRLSAAQSSVAT
ncbi:hypothetical protein CspHIS471_0701020 [Cutaneotrichosporon sp. HIS471]|nr:hypothetical protein CspHIS471_0701020 [Cutaneotrichosporon sp. HIS471]